MTDFQRDLEVLINEGFIAPNKKNKVRFVFRYENRMNGELGLLNLNERSYNCLRRNKINDVRGVSERWDTLGKMRNAGDKTVKAIKNNYISYYYDNLNEEERKQFWRDTIEATINME